MPQLVEVDLESRLRQTIEAGLPYAAFPHGFLSGMDSWDLIGRFPTAGEVDSGVFLQWLPARWFDGRSLCAQVVAPEPWQVGLLFAGGDTTMLVCLLAEGHDGDHGWQRVLGSYLPRTDPVAL